MRNLFFIISALAVLVTCDKDDDPVVEESHLSKRTVLVYAAAENNLDPFLDDDLEEMKTGSLQLGRSRIL